MVGAMRLMKRYRINPIVLSQVKHPGFELLNRGIAGVLLRRVQLQYLEAYKQSRDCWGMKNKRKVIMINGEEGQAFIEERKFGATPENKRGH